MHARCHAKVAEPPRIVVEMRNRRGQALQARSPPAMRMPLPSTRLPRSSPSACHAYIPVVVLALCIPPTWQRRYGSAKMRDKQRPVRQEKVQPPEGPR